MPEYIERETLLEKIKAHVVQIPLVEEDRDMFFHNSGFNCEVTGAVLEVEHAPAADVAPVVHGRWIRYHEADLGWDEYGYRCSECKMEIEDKDFWDMFEKRCPNCGARMDGDSR